MKTGKDEAKEEIKKKALKKQGHWDVHRDRVEIEREIGDEKGRQRETGERNREKRNERWLKKSSQ